PRIVVRHNKDQLASAERAIALTRSADVIVSHNIALAGFLAAQVNAKPLVTAHLFPSLIPSSQSTPNGTEIGRLGNALIWWLATRVVRRTCDDLFNEIVAPYGVAPLRDALLRSARSQTLNLVAISPTVVERDPLWPDGYESTGYWFMPEAPYTPEARLARFLAEGEPPIVITFGSMFGVDPAALTKLLVETVAKTGRRAILQAGWAGLGKTSLPSTI